MASILGVDPALATFGWALVDVARDGRLQAHYAGVIRTAKSDRKVNVLASADSLRRCRELHRALAQCLGHRAIAAESMSWPRNAGAAAKVALAWGVLAGYAEQRGLSILQASPQAVKKALCGVASASKEDVEAAVLKRVEGAQAAVDRSGLPRGLHEHMYDAMAVVVACADADVVRMINGPDLDKFELTRPNEIDHGRYETHEQES